LTKRDRDESVSTDPWTKSQLEVDQSACTIKMEEPGGFGGVGSRTLTLLAEARVLRKKLEGRKTRVWGGEHGDETCRDPVPWHKGEKKGHRISGKCGHSQQHAALEKRW